MPGLSLRIRTPRKDQIIRASKKTGISISAFIIESIAKALAKEFPLTIRDIERGEERLSTVITNEMKSEVSKEAERLKIKPNEYAVMAVIDYAEQKNSASNLTSTELLDHAFDKSSLLENGMKYRRSQHALSRAIINHLDTGSIGLNEASTGTGKAYACIAAAYAFAKKTKQKVVVSTFTRALQKQLQKTSEQVSKVVGEQVNCVTIYGKRNYVSPVHLKEILKLNKGISKAEIEKCETWAGSTETWLVADLESELNSTTFPYELVTIPDQCNDGKALLPYREAIMKASEADVVITSHHMLLFAMMSKVDFLGFRPEHVILDEAHLIEPAAHSVFGNQMSVASSRWGVKRLIEKMQELGKKKAAGELTKWLYALESFEKTVIKHSRKDEDVLQLIKRDGINGSIKDSADKIDILSKVPNIPRTVRLSGVFLHSLIEIRNSARIFHQIKESSQQTNRFESDIFASLSPVKRFVRIVATSRWFISKDIERVLWKKVNGASLVSATIYLPVASGKESPKEFVNSIGLKNMPYVAEPPFYEAWVYENLSIYAAPKNWCEPASSEHNQEGNKEWINSIVKLADDLNKIPVSDGHGGIMILCTSYADSKAIASLLKKTGKRKIIEYKKSNDMRSVQAKFIEADGHAILVALGGFWTGVDFPGRMLTDEIITRLPLLSASDPSVLSRFTWAKENIGFPAAFASILLPRMGITLRQGVGRVIRTPNDRGRIFITDPRIHTHPNWRVKTLLRKYEPILGIPKEKK